jgi:hypothetical protein
MVEGVVLDARADRLKAREMAVPGSDDAVREEHADRKPQFTDHVDEPRVPFGAVVVGQEDDPVGGSYAVHHGRQARARRPYGVGPGGWLRGGRQGGRQTPAAVRGLPGPGRPVRPDPLGRLLAEPFDGVEVDGLGTAGQDRGRQHPGRQGPQSPEGPRPHR